MDLPMVLSAEASRDLPRATCPRGLDPLQPRATHPRGLDPLQGLRGLAALHVMFFHFYVDWGR